MYPQYDLLPKMKAEIGQKIRIILEEKGMLTYTMQAVNSAPDKNYSTSFIRLGCSCPPLPFSLLLSPYLFLVKEYNIKTKASF